MATPPVPPPRETVSPLIPHHPADSDKLDFDHYAQAIVDLLASLKTEQTGLTIGIFGDWGSGKSTLLNLVARKMKSASEKFLLVEFKAWEYGKPEEVWVAFLRTIVSEIENNNSFGRLLWLRYALWRRRLKWNALVYRAIWFGFRSLAVVGAIVAAIIFYGLLKLMLLVFPGTQNILEPFLTLLVNVVGVTSVVVASWPILSVVVGLLIKTSQSLLSAQLQLPPTILRQTFDQGQPLAVELFRADLNDLIREVGQDRPLIVLIDDLDRAPIEQIVPVLEAIKHFGAKPGGDPQHKAPIAFIVAVDREVIEEAIVTHYKNFTANLDKQAVAAFAREYLEKIVQIPFQLPPLRRQALEKILPDELQEAALKTLFAQGFRGTPREVIQAYNTFRAVSLVVEKRGLVGQIQDDILAALILMRYLAPDVFDQLHRYPELFFDLHAQATQLPNKECTATEIEELLVLRCPTPGAFVETISRDYPILSPMLTAINLSPDFDVNQLNLHLTLYTDPAGAPGVVNVSPLVESPAALLSGDPTRIKFFDRLADKSVNRQAMSLMTSLELKTAPTLPEKKAPAMSAEAEAEMVAAIFALGRLENLTGAYKDDAVNLLKRIIDLQDLYSPAIVNRAIFALAHLGALIPLSDLLIKKQLSDNQNLRVLRLLDRMLSSETSEKPLPLAKGVLAQAALRNDNNLLRDTAHRLAVEYNCTDAALDELTSNEDQVALEGFFKLVEEISTKKPDVKLTDKVINHLITLASGKTDAAQERAFKTLTGFPGTEGARKVITYVSKVAEQTQQPPVWQQTLQKMSELQKNKPGDPQDQILPWQAEPWERVQKLKNKLTYTDWWKALSDTLYPQAFQLLVAEGSSDPPDENRQDIVKHLKELYTNSTEATAKDLAKEALKKLGENLPDEEKSKNNP